jgi:RNA polymerase sigma factor (sigma-70 family)
MKATPSGAARAPEPAAWEHLATRVQRGDDSAMRELYEIFAKGVRFMLFRQLGPDDLDDKVHDIFLIITQAIRNGELREPSRLMGYIHTIVRRQIVGYIDRAVSLRRTRVELDFNEAICDARPDPENEAIERENEQLALRVLQSIPKRDREVLTRFYLREESPDQICRALNLTDTQFRLIKSRAKARFGELGRRRLASKGAGRL